MLKEILISTCLLTIGLAASGMDKVGQEKESISLENYLKLMQVYQEADELSRKVDSYNERLSNQDVISEEFLFEVEEMEKQKRNLEKRKEKIMRATIKKY